MLFNYVLAANDDVNFDFIFMINDALFHCDLVQNLFSRHLHWMQLFKFAFQISFLINYIDLIRWIPFLNLLKPLES